MISDVDLGQLRPLLVPDDPPASAGGWTVAQWQRAAEADPGAANALMLPVASGDYVGSLIDKANRRYLLETYVDEDCFIVLHWEHWTRGLALRLAADPDVVRAVLDDVARMEECGIADDGTYQELLDELVEEALHGWALDDARAELGREGYDTDMLGPADLGRALDAAVRAGTDYPYDEGHGDGNIVLPMGAILHQLRAALPPAAADPLSADRSPIR